MRVESGNIYQGWARLMEQVMLFGIKAKPRGMVVRELTGTQLHVRDLLNNIIVHPVRDLNYRFMVAEWLWIEAGRNDVETVARYNKQIAKFSDDGAIFNGAYGPRMALQRKLVLDLLRRDPDTRQAVLVIYRDDELDKATKDVPCTLSLQVLLRDGRLHGVVTMRSWDLWLGCPYDFFNFSQIVNGLAGELRVLPGSMTYQAGSAHLYETNWDKVEEVLGTVDEGNFLRSPYLKGGVDAQAILDLRAYPSLSIHDGYQQVLTASNKAKALDRLWDVYRLGSKEVK